jgi:hypothetical protein
MIETWHVLIISIFLAILSTGIALLMLKRSNQAMAYVLETYKEGLENLIKETQEQFEKYDPLISKAFSIIGKQGVQSKALAKGEEIFTQEFMNHTEIGVLLQAVGKVFPRFGEWAEENPDLALQLAPRILAFAKQSGILDQAGIPSSTPGKHPFGLREE